MIAAHQGSEALDVKIKSATGGCMCNMACHIFFQINLYLHEFVCHVTETTCNGLNGGLVVTSAQEHQLHHGFDGYFNVRPVEHQLCKLKEEEAVDVEIAEQLSGLRIVQNME